MMYPFLTLNDGTEIVHSEKSVSGEVKVYIEKPDKDLCFRNVYCILPGYKFENNNGFSAEEIEYYKSIIESTAHLIMQFAEQGGFENAAGL